MNHPWMAEHSVDAHLALSLIQEQFPELQAKKAELLGAGWDNTAYLVDGQFVFRFPRKEMTASLLENERLLLPKIAPLLPLSIPLPEWSGQPANGYPWPFLGYRQLPGKTACSANFSDDERVAVAPVLAHFLSKLHQIPITKELDALLPGDLLQRLNFDRLHAKIRENIDKLAALGFHVTENFLSQTHDLFPPPEKVIVHGDFYVRHFLIDEHRQFTGIIDWGDIHKNSPAVDLMVAHAFLPPKAHDLFRQTYGPIAENTWKVARLRAFMHCTALSVYGRHINDQDITREGDLGLKYILDRSD